MKLETEASGLFVPIFAVLGCGAALAGLVIFIDEIGRWRGTMTAGSVIAMLFGIPIGGLMLVAWLSGGKVLEVDVPAGMVHYVDARERKASTPLAELGELAVEEKHMNGLRNQRVTWFELHAPGLPERVLFQSPRREEVDARRALLRGLVARSALRRVFSTGTADAGPLRDSPEVVYRARQAVTDATLLHDATEALVADRDPAIRAQAAALRDALRVRST